MQIPDLGDIRIERSEPLALDIPRNLRRRFQVANGDVHADADDRTIVFGGRTGNNASWDIYLADVNVATGVLEDVRPLVADRRVREEDPRFSWSGSQIVYKCDGKICLVNSDGSNAREIVVEPGCELWAPALDQTGFVVTYVQRCDGSGSDRIAWYAFDDKTPGNSPTIVPSKGGGPDRFPYFTPTGEIVYSHLDSDSGTSSLWLLYPLYGTTELLHSETESDDDPYVYHADGRYVAFSGWGRDAYDLYIYNRQTDAAAQVTRGVNVLGTILFD